MQKLLQPSKRTQKAAYKTPQQHADQNECPGDVIRKAELRRAHHRLKRPDGARARGSRTRVAVEPRHADGFARPLVDASLGKVGQMDVGRERRRRLNQSAESRQKARYGVYSFIQFRYTPSTA